MGGPCQPPSWGEGWLVGASFNLLPATSIHPSRLPAECILPGGSRGMCIFYLPIVSCLPARDIWDSPKMSLASEPAVLATLSALLLEEKHALLPSNSFVAGLARTNLVFDCSRAASSGLL
jgi:hypothetical protein